MGDPETIIEVAGEGGSIMLLSERKADGVPRFRVITNEAAFDDDDFPGVGTYSTSSEWVDSFSAASVLLDKYPWTELYPTTVHLDYLDQTLKAVHKRGGKTAELRWREALGG